MISGVVSFAIWHLRQMWLSIKEYYRIPSDSSHHFPSVEFVWSILVPQEPGNWTVPTSRAPRGWNAYIWQGAAWFPEGIVCDAAITTSLSCSLRHDTSHLGFGGPETFCRPKTLPLFAIRTPRVGFWRGQPISITWVKNRWRPWLQFTEILQASTMVCLIQPSYSDLNPNALWQSTGY
jgi:hypothetical protein